MQPGPPTSLSPLTQRATWLSSLAGTHTQSFHHTLPLPGQPLDPRDPHWLAPSHSYSKASTAGVGNKG